MNTGVLQMLIKSAYTGVAASLIGGKTTHKLAHLTTRSQTKLSGQMIAKLQSFWRDKKYLIIDEYSMISKSFLAKLACNISIGMGVPVSDQGRYTFEGLNVILCGDLHQFPPVARPPREYLYQPINLSEDPIDCQLGRTIYEEFTTVVILREQKRVTDPVWLQLLRNLRKGQVQ
jgi:PIF1-like helicase